MAPLLAVIAWLATAPVRSLAFIAIMAWSVTVVLLMTEGDVS